MKLAVITGASAGIGLEAAELFINRGYRVLNIARRTTTHNDIIDIQCDMSVPGAIDAIETRLISEFETAQTICLVHNACRMLKDSVRESDADAIRGALEVNLIGPSCLNKVAIPHMQAGSSILYIGSTLSEKAVAGTFSYVTSKHAVAGMMKASCQDLMGSGIHTACICPGFTDTEMLRNHLGNDEEVLRHIASMNGYNRLVEASEIAELIGWAHANPVINGSILHANLGQIES